jgi:pimeloyl-ACP methyl ester carboxylesterase
MEQGFTQGIVRVDGASIYYERRGDGPALLLISGGRGPAAEFTRVADLLADDYTVLTFDRRAVGRSQWQGPKRQFSVLQQAQDAAAVITANGFESASVVGCSSGATIVLEMVAACPAAVSRAVAYEPPVISGLPDRGELFDFYDHLEAMAVEGRAFEALAEHLRRCGLPELIPSLIPDPPPSPDSEQLRNTENFVKEDMQVITYYRPDYARLSASEVPLVIAYGRDGLDLNGPGKPVFTVRAAQVAAKRIGVEAVEFPGNHILQLVDPAAFAEALRPLLRPSDDRVTGVAS